MQEVRQLDIDIEGQISRALGEVNEHALLNIRGFQWLTYYAHDSIFSESLRIVCVFDTKNSLSEAYSHGDDEKLRQLILYILKSIEVNITDIERAVKFATEDSGNITTKVGEKRRYH